MDYVSGTSDAALNSSSPSHVSSHHIHRHKESFSPSTEQPGLKNKFCAIHQPRGPAGQGRDLWGHSQGSLPSPAWPGAAKGSGVAAGMSQHCWRAATSPAARCHLPYSISSCSSPRGGCSVSRRWQQAVTVPWASPLLPSSSQPVFQAHFWN